MCYPNSAEYDIKKKAISIESGSKDLRQFLNQYTRIGLKKDQGCEFRYELIKDFNPHGNLLDPNNWGEIAKAIKKSQN